MINPVIYWQIPGTKNKIIEALQDNKVLITTTDTIPGFLANTTSQGFAALNTIKQGRQNKPYIILISDSQKLDCFVEPEQLTQQIKNLIKQFWPGPLTIIFKAKKELPHFLKSEQGTVAIRCPNYAPLLEILKHFNGLYSTSANTSSNPAPATIKAVDEQVVLQVKYLVDDNNSKDSQSHSTKPSTIIDISNMAQSSNTCVGNTHVAQIHVIRQGAYSIQELEKILGNQIQVK